MEQIVAQVAALTRMLETVTGEAQKAAICDAHCASIKTQLQNLTVSAGDVEQFSTAMVESGCLEYVVFFSDGFVNTGFLTIDSFQSVFFRNVDYSSTFR